jgi:phage N-6-adenine-methyltransferase
MAPRAPKQTNTKNRNTWATPPAVAAYWVERCGLGLDVAASDTNHVCPLYITEEEDGLTAPWAHRFWCNPPYDNILPWVEKALTSGRTGVMLLPARTDSAWFRLLVEAHGVDIYFSRGRIRFVPPEGVKASSNTHGSIIAEIHDRGHDIIGCFDPKTGEILKPDG